MDAIENRNYTEEYLYIKKEIKEIKLAVIDLLDRSKELSAENEELSKENKKLRDIIQEMSQEK